MLVALLSGCAALAPVPVVTQPPAQTAPAPAVSPPAAPSPPARIDTTRVSAEASAVLTTIPEPLAPGERVPPPAGGAPVGPGIAMPAPEAAYDTLRTSLPLAGDDSGADSTGVPVPEPTLPLGDRPGTLRRLLAPDSTARDSIAAKSAASALPAPAPAPAAPDTCWRVQVAAPEEPARADQLRAAAESQLLVRFVVERDRKLSKVRSAGCLTRAGAESLRRRAVLAGFDGAFRFVGSAR
jgi:hypothetical protein